MYGYGLDPRITETREFAELPDVEKALVVSVIRLDTAVASMRANAQFEYQSNQVDGAFRSGLMVGLALGAALLALVIIVNRPREVEE